MKGDREEVYCSQGGGKATLQRQNSLDVMCEASENQRSFLNKRVT